MKEELISFAWMYRLAGRSFRSTAGERIEVEHPGVINRNAGPDFLNARVRIGDTLWAGNVEIHDKASDWEKHQHNDDLKYSNVILHVVMDYDMDVFTLSNRKMACLELSQYLTDDLAERYRNLNESTSAIPCHSFLHQLNWPPLLPWLSRLALERMEDKANAIIRETINYPEDDRITRLALFSAFGIPANRENFEILGRRFLGIENISSLNQNDTEAVLFTISGMLENPEDSWSIEHKRNGGRICQNLKIIDPGQWSYLRMRPTSFPSLRIALLAALWVQLPENLWKACRELSLDQWMEVIDVQASAYWDQHYQIGKESPRTFKKRITGQFKTTLIANWLAPMLTAAGLLGGDHGLVRKAFTALERTAPENNRVTRKWQDLSLEKISATESQGLIQLYQDYCQKKRCLECRIGYLILKPG